MRTERPPLPLRRLLRIAQQAGPAASARLLRALPPPDIAAIEEEWSWQARRPQREPPGDWRVWTIMAGRGFGKTRAGAEWVWARARDTPDARIALVGASIEEVAKVMVEGESGILACARAGEAARWIRSRGVLHFPSGATGLAYSGAKPAKLRGPQHHYAWCDELAKWLHPRSSWDNLMLGLRLGERPRTMVTTTPAAVDPLVRWQGMERFAFTHGSTFDNPSLPNEYVAAVSALYEGTRLGRQELHGEMLLEAEGSLWPRALIERCRAPAAPAGLARIAIGVDPPARAHGDECGIVVCGRDEAGVHHVLADASAGGLRPQGWARRVALAAEAWQADRVVAECNNGGDMVESVLRAVEPGLPVKLVCASRGKVKRAEPVAGLFEGGAARFAGHFPALEDQLAGMMAGGGYAGPGRSPDRADAMVWALTELMKGSPAEPRIRGL